MSNAKPAGALPGATPPGPLRLLVTRPQPQADEWVHKLAGLGVQAWALPLLAIAPAADAAAVRAAWQAVPGLALVMFVSPNAVQRFMALRPAGLAWPAGVLAAGTGPGTWRALAAAGVPAAMIRTPGGADPAPAGPFDSEALWQLLAPLDWACRQALIVRGEGGRDWLADALRQQGAQVHFVEAYRRTCAVLDPPARALLQQAQAAPARHLWLLSSSEALGHLPTLAPGLRWAEQQALATHARIAQAAAALGFGHVSLSAPTPAAVAQAVLAWPADPAPLALSALSGRSAGVPTGLPAGGAPIQSVPP